MTDPTTDQYHALPPTPHGGDEGVGPLPFTGFDLGAMVAVCVAVTALGLVLRRLNRVES